MSTEHTVDFLVQYTDPDRPVDGEVKTRWFVSEQQARQFLETLPTMAPRAYGIKLERWSRTIKKEMLFRG